ncbi:fibroblast growth factor-binding protein 2b [Gadus chalcogrammus]|uniref:fibroblast growth factor-binding protein 2b n=1 Tax=Gadus chalcogrammus TaxID=1042646 RepID=UPI0024C2853F|nr:fibroblast growth factor-binding protein 2b [Gadus chalcogrammus]
MPLLLALLATLACVSHAQSDNSVDNRAPAQPSQRGIWDEPIRFSTKSKDACAMAVSGAGDYTRLRVSCRGPSAPGGAAGRSYYCDFQGKPNLCRAYSQNPRHYFTQVMWELRKLSHACQGPKIYRPAMCKKYPDEAHPTSIHGPLATDLAGYSSAAAPPHLANTPAPHHHTSKPSKPSQDQRRPVAPAQAKPASPYKPVKPQPARPQPQPAKPQGGAGSKAASQPKKPTTKQGKASPNTIPRPTEGSDASRMATEYCWKSLHGFCSYFIGWFHN